MPSPNMSDLERINLTDAYLRDDNTMNDIVVIPVLEPIIADSNAAPIDRLHAKAQMFMYNLFWENFEDAKHRADDIVNSELLKAPGVAGTEFAHAMALEVPNIYLIAHALSTGNEDELLSAQ